MKTLIPFILSQLEASRNAALATVLIAKGSAPRGAGACMVLLADGTAVGTVGGGVLEHHALRELQMLLDACPTTSEDHTVKDNTADTMALAPGNPSRIHEYALTQDDVQNLGMVCGGNVSLLYQVFTPNQLPFFRSLASALTGKHNLWLVRTLDREEVKQLALSDGVHNPTPLEDSRFRSLCGRKALWYTPPGAQGEAATGRAGYFVEPVSFVSHAYLFGGGHVSQRVAPLLAQLDFAPVVYDDRPDFATQALFPTAADVICAPFAEAGARLTVTPDDEIIIMTRGHANDLAILTWALHTSAYYIGLIGSRSKIAHTKDLLLQQGFTEADFARVHTPIGLPICAETPMEIAVSVSAEMILCRAMQAEQTGTSE